MDENTMTTLETAREKLVKILREHNLLDEPVEVLARFLTPEEAIGTPGRRDFPIVRGKEKMLEATIRGARGQSFTDSRREFVGTVAQVLALPLLPGLVQYLSMLSVVLPKKSLFWLKTRVQLVMAHGQFKPTSAIIIWESFAQHPHPILLCNIFM